MLCQAHLIIITKILLAFEIEIIFFFQNILKSTYLHIIYCCFSFNIQIIEDI